MSGLAELQARFVDAVLGTHNAAAPTILDTIHFSARQRLGVYANAYRRRLIEAISSVYERCQQATGEAAFETQALEYVESHPPASRALRWYADDFPEWLRTRATAPARMADLAIIDRGLRRAFDAADAQALTRDALLALAPTQWMQLRLDWHPALSVAHCAAAAIALWHGESEASTSVSDQGASTALAFWRHQDQTLFRSLGAAEADLLQRLRADASLAEACLQGHGPMPIEGAAAALLSWVDAGWVIAIRVDDVDPTRHFNPSDAC